MMKAFIAGRGVIGRCLILIALAILCGCGGGTTGTSGTGELRLFGQVVSDEGQPLADQAMTVVDPNSLSLILRSQTDSRGAFSMVIQRPENGVSLIIDGNRSEAVVPELNGDLSMTTLVELDEQETLILRRKIEAKLSLNERCSGVEVIGGEVHYIGEEEASDCALLLEVLSAQALPLEAGISVTCGGEPRRVQYSTIPSGTGEVILSLDGVIETGCESISVDVRPLDGGTQSITFPFSKKR